MKRGDLVLADLPYSDGTGSKVRPAVIVSTDRNNPILDDVILAAISRFTRTGAFTHVFLDPTTPEGQLAGVLHPCFIQCENLFTLDKKQILHRIGYLDQVLQSQLQESLKKALDLP